MFVAWEQTVPVQTNNLHKAQQKDQNSRETLKKI